MNRMLVCLALGLALTGPAEAQKRTKYAVTVTLAGVGAGTVTSSPAGISCPSTCTFQFNSGTDVVLTATPSNGSTFSGWTGDCAGAATCQLSALAAPKNVTADFSLANMPYEPKLISVDCGMGGSQLIQTLGLLNPLADKYLIQVTGKCAGPIELDGFAWLRIESRPYTGNIATVGQIRMINSNGYVRLNDLRIEATAGTAGIEVTSAGRLEALKVQIICAENQPTVCTDAVSSGYGADLRLYSVTLGGNMDPHPAVKISRGGTAVIAYEINDEAHCPPFTISAQNGSAVRIVTANSFCVVPKVRAINGAVIEFVGTGSAKIATIDISNGSVFGLTDDSANFPDLGVWFLSLACQGPAALVSDWGTTASRNYCAQ